MRLHYGIDAPWLLRNGVVARLALLIPTIVWFTMFYAMLWA